MALPEAVATYLDHVSGYSCSVPYIRTCSARDVLRTVNWTPVNHHVVAKKLVLLTELLSDSASHANVNFSDILLVANGSAIILRKLRSLNVVIGYDS